jgi:diguanylate cyclase (GGDEF)-like protein
VRLNRRLGIVTASLRARTRLLSERLLEEQTIANTDPVTGLLTRRAITTDLQRVVAAAMEAGERGAVGLADLDSLKAVNDQHGHLAGDDLLRRVASALAIEEVRVGRFGGDEFVVILPKASAVEVEAYLALVGWRLDMKDGAIGFEDPPTSISFGFAFYPEESDDPFELLQIADERMYRDKNRRKSGSIKDLAA